MRRRHFALAALACALPAWAAERLKAGEFNPPRVAPDIGLPAADGKLFSMAAQRGKVVVLAFGFSSCSEVCPVSLAMLATARKQLGNRLQVVFVSVDPERDTAPVLREYMAKFDPSFIGITGTRAQIDAVMRDYGITASRHLIGKGPDYTIGHSSYLYFIDPKGMLRALLPFGHPAADVVHDVNVLLPAA